VKDPDLHSAWLDLSLLSRAVISVFSGRTAMLQNFHQLMNSWTNESGTVTRYDLENMNWAISCKIILQTA
jgi:hypothetical protein